MKKLISFLALIYRHFLSIRMINDSKSLEKKLSESELSVLVIPVDDSKKEKKDPLALSSVMTELVVNSEKNKQIFCNVEGVEQKEVVANKDVSEGTFSVDDTKKK